MDQENNEHGAEHSMLMLINIMLIYMIGFITFTFKPCSTDKLSVLKKSSDDDECVSCGYRQAERDSLGMKSRMRLTSGLKESVL